jgi:hypothetical protein
MNIYKVTTKKKDGSGVEFNIAAQDSQEASMIADRILSVAILKKEESFKEEITQVTPEEEERLNKLFGG